MAVAALLAAASRSESQAEERSVKMQSMDTGDILYTLIGGGSNSLALARDGGSSSSTRSGQGWAGR